jgi:tetratricopeptide (TPR) repeat protein
MSDRTPTPAVPRHLPLLAPKSGRSRLGAGTKAAGLVIAVGLLSTGLAGVPFAEEAVVEDPYEQRSLVGSYLASRMAQGQRDTEAATEFLDQVLTQDPDNEIVLNQAFLNETQIGNFARAELLAAKLVKVQPNNRVARLVLATKAFRERNWAEADRQFKDAAASPIGELTSALGRAWTAQARGDTKAAQSQIDGLQQADWTRFYKAYNRALIADAGGDAALAAKTYEEVFTQEPRTVAVVLSYADFLSRKGDAAKAREVLKKNLAAVRAPHPMPLAAVAALRRGEAPPSQGLSQLLYGLGEALAAEGGVDLGMIYVQLALHLEPKSPLALAALAAVQEQAKQYSRAIDTYARLPDTEPLAVSFALRRSLNLSALDKPDDAKAVLTKLLEKPLLDIPIQDPPLSMELVTAAKALTPQEPRAKGPAVEALQRTLALAGFSAGKVDGVYGSSTQDAVRKIQTAASLPATGTFDAATAKALADQLAKSASGTAQQPTRNLEIEVHTSIGDIQRGRKEFADAAIHYGRAIDLVGAKPEKRHWEQFYARGIAFERTKQWPKAEADFLKALELNPDEASVLNYLGYSWVDQGLYLDKALAMIAKAVKLRPDDGYIVDSLGWAYYKLGRYDEAVVQLERAVELRADDSVLNDHLGDAYWRAGRRLEAKFQWSWSLSMKPEPEEIPKLKAKLDKGLEELKPETAAKPADKAAAEPAKTP